MKNWGIFIGGVATGVILTFLVAFIYAYSGNNSPDGVTNFEQPGQVIEESSVKVLQVVGNNAALVNGEGDYDYKGEPYYYDGPIYLLRNYVGEYYYDNQIIKRPLGKQFKQTGIYRYKSAMGYKTVAIIEIQ